MVSVLVVLALFAPLVAPYDPNSQQLAEAYRPPVWLPEGSPNHLLGTDSLGRDIFSRVLYGGRVALFVAVVATLFSALIGVTVGLLAGYYRGWVDELIMRLVDMWMSLPPVLLAVVLMAILGVGAWKVALAIILVDWTRFARVVRSEVFNIRERDFIEAARALGMPDRSIIWQEVVPNIIPLVIVLASLEMGLAIIIEALLSFVGLGVKASTPSWGSMISEGLGYFRVGWWGLIFPMGFLIITVFAFNLLGDGLRKELDPRLTLTE
uniref:Peptide/nickel transport system permease protein n=1 Tax=uncultured Chloroflexota bacterium TaxID=166587 RepID=H5SN44_9CHLR|nr:peptide/nickel transport system permease protein [uncultured Chloroflexota bacterium]